ncbi:MAG: von Willebrand factor type A domain-containing protein [Bacteroidales bacterium]|nr:von Willebrand factor type A domain-containing protein [Bacteroidales bacterium]
MKKLFLLFILFVPFALLAQKTITGTVTDGVDPIKGVKVTVKGENISTLTDANGKYTLKNVSEHAILLVFEKEEFVTVNERINGRSVINIEMDYAEIELIEVDLIDIVEEVDAEEFIMADISYEEPAEEVALFYMPTKSNDKRKGNKETAIYFDNGNNTEEYSNIVENEYKEVVREPLSTFSIDVDNASYSNVRRFLNSNQMPPNDAVRIEEMINYFDYDYPSPKGDQPFSVITEISDAPWNKDHKLIHIGIQGKKIDYEDLKPSNLVFLIDVSGSMSDQNKLPLLKESLKMLVNGLSSKDKVSIVVYAGAAGVVLESTPANETDKIFKALDALQSGGSTAGGAGIELAYKICQKNLIQDGNNRVILCTDGDFNVGTSSTGSLVDMITEFRQKHDIYITICGFGMGNYKDDKMEEISNAGNGNYFYIDNKSEAEKVFVKDLRANMFTIAKDVKIQIEFNPAEVKAYRLIGYENRLLNNEDFDDDKKDAGEIGAGHTVTALYEIIPAGSDEKINETGDLKYQKTGLTNLATSSNEIMTLKLRYKPIHSEKSILIEQIINKKDIVPSNKTSDNFRFSASVAAFGMLLRDSKFIENFSYDDVLELAKNSYKKDDQYQKEFLTLVEKAKTLSGIKHE